MYKTFRRGFVGVGAVALSVSMIGSASATPRLDVKTVDGQAVKNGAIPRPVSGDRLRVTGTADASAPLVVDAGDSSTVLSGEPASLIGSAHGGAGAITYAWSFGGAAARFSDPTAYQTDFDTTGLTGKVPVTLTATDANGAKASDVVNVFTYVAKTETLLDKTVDSGPSTPAAPTSDRYPFTVPVNTQTLDLTLSWGQSYKTGVVTGRGFDLTVDDPSDAEDGNQSGAAFEEPERMHIARPALGDWAAIVTGSANVPDTYHLTAVGMSQPPDPVPTISAGGPYAFAVGAPQQLKATIHGGTAPLKTAWDLDYDGVFETADTASGVRASLPVGTNFVTVKTTDAAGYERRDTTVVRVGVAAPTNAAFVVVGVSDTGLNVYHRDFRASTFPDAAILAATDNFTKHPSTYLPGFPADAVAKNLTFDTPFAPGKLYPEADAALWTKEANPVNKLFWIPGTKIVGIFDGGDIAPVNGAADTTPILDDDGHGTKSADVAVGNIYGYCGTCLLAFGESNSADATLYTFPWVDMVSNSHGAVGNVGTAGIAFDVPQPKENAERGQMAFYAAGNGTGNSFESPEQTYLSESVGPGWVVRVGAVDKPTRKPILGTGKPVDISSFGLGDEAGANSLPAAGNDSPTAMSTHSGTSAATPYTTGVFGTVLRTVRAALGDTRSGQKNLVPGDGIIAAGTPIPSSPYLADGQLTRAELTEAVLKTAEHDTGGDTSIGYPVTTPPNDAQYVFEGYGIAEPASGARALDVLMGRAPLPDRADEDAFFAVDQELRAQLYGSWSGGGANSAHAASASASASASTNRFAGVTSDQLQTWPQARHVIVTKAGPVVSATTADATTPTIDITSPAPGATVDPTKTPALLASGVAGFKATVGEPPSQLRLYPFWENGDTPGSCGDSYLTTEVRTDDSGCSSTVEALGVVDPSIPRETYAFDDTTAHALEPGTPITGTLTYFGNAPFPAHTINVSVFATTPDGVTHTLGSQEVSGAVIGVLGAGPETTFAYSFPVADGLSGVPLTGFVLQVDTDLGVAAVMDRDNGASFLNLPLAGTAADPGSVAVTVDDPTFAHPIAATTADGGWNASIPVTALPDGTHTLYARASQAGAAATASRSFTVKRASSLPPAVVQLQVMRAGAEPANAKWVAATDTSANHTWSAWTGNLDITGLPKGTYTLRSRLLIGGKPAATAPPVKFVRK